MSRSGLGRNDPCFCGSGKKYKNCCYPRTLPDFSKPDAGLPSAFEEREALYRALSRLEANPPRDENVTFANMDVGRTRLFCAPLPTYGDGIALPGTLAPPTPLQIDAKYEAVRRSNRERATELLVTYTYPELFGFAEVQAVFDADEFFLSPNGTVISIMDLFRGMQVQMSEDTIGTIVGNPERRYDIPIPPLPEPDGLWMSRVVGRVKHTAHEIVQFRWGGQMVEVTPGHAVWSASRRGWVGAHELYVGEMIRVAGNMVAPVEGVRRVPGFVEVFGIEVEYFHNYFVGTGPNAMLVHNGPRCLEKPASAEEAAVPTQRRTLYHYTNERGLEGITSSETLRPSLRAVNPRDVRYGEGQYLSDIVPGTRTPGQLSYSFLNDPRGWRRFTHYVEIDVTGLTVVEGRPGVFVIPSTQDLNLAGRIVSSGPVPRPPGR